MLIYYFQVVRIFLTFSFFIEFSPPDISLRNFLHLQIASSGPFHTAKIIELV